jgi:hypothetical protein
MPAGLSASKLRGRAMFGGVMPACCLRFHHKSSCKNRILPGLFVLVLVLEAKRTPRVRVPSRRARTEYEYETARKMWVNLSLLPSRLVGSLVGKSVR